MDDEKTKEKEESKREDGFEIVFKNGAFDNLQRLSGSSEPSEEELREVVEKAVKLLTYVSNAKNGKLLFTDKESGELYNVDINKL